MRLSNSKLLSYSILLVLFLILSCDSRVPTNVTNEPGDGDINQLNVWVNSGYIVLDGVNSIPQDTIYAQILDENGGPINDVSVNFAIKNENSYGSLSSINVSSDSTGMAMSIYSIQPGQIPDEVDSVEIDIEVTVSNKSEMINLSFDIDPTWKYPELNVDPNGFNFYPNVDELIHIIGTEENIKVISKNSNGVGICNVPVYFRLENNNQNISYGEINQLVSESCESNQSNNDEDNSGQTTSTDSTAVAENGISSIKYTNLNGTIEDEYDILIAYVKDPNNDNQEIAVDSLNIKSISQEEINLEQIAFIHVWTKSSELSIENFQGTYTDTIYAEALDQYGSRVGNVLFNFQLENIIVNTEWGSLEASSVISDSSGLAINTFRTYPNIFNNEEEDHLIDISVSVPGSSVSSQNISINLLNNLPICSNCESQLTLTTSPNTLPYDNPENNDLPLEQSTITAFMVDSLGNPPAEGTIIEFQSKTQDENGDWVDFGYIEPYKYFDETGFAHAVFNMGNDAGLATIIGSSNGLSDTAYIVINSTNASYIEVVPSYPSEITVSGGGGQEATEAAVQIKDGNGNLVTGAYKLFFQIESPSPEGVHLNGIEGSTNAIQMSTVGQSAITINSGNRPGSVKISCKLYPNTTNDSDILDGTAEEDAYAEWEPVTIATGAPEFGEINFSPVDITPINGGMYELPISISLWDIHSNPVSDSTGVYVWIEENAEPWDSTGLIVQPNPLTGFQYHVINPETGFPDTVKYGTSQFDSLAYICIQDHDNTVEVISPTNQEYWQRVQQPAFADGTTKTGGLNASGDAYSGIAWSSIYYSSATTFSRIVIKAQTFTNDLNDQNQLLIIDSRDNHDGEATILPFQPGQIIVSSSVQFWDFNPEIDGHDFAGFTDAITIQAQITDYYGYPIDNGNVILVAQGAAFEGFNGADNPFENPKTTNAQGIAQWTIAYNEALCQPESNEPPITYADFTSSVVVQLLDPTQISSDPVDISLTKSEIGE